MAHEGEMDGNVTEKDERQEIGKYWKDWYSYTNSDGEFSRHDLTPIVRAKS